jgi:hypothetical protein
VTINPYKINVKVAGDLFAEPESSATVLHAILLSTYKDALYGNPETGEPPMDPVALWLAVKEDFRTYPHENNENKINALMLGLSTDAFYEDPLAFRGICMSLYDGDLGDMVNGVVEDLTVPELLWGIYEIELNRDDVRPFMGNVVHIIDETISLEADERFGGEEPAVVPYFEEIIQVKQEHMFNDMRAVGWPEAVIRRIAMQELTPRLNDEAEVV